LSNQNLNIEIQHRLIEELTRSNEELQIINRYAVAVQGGFSTQEVQFRLCEFCQNNFGYSQSNIRLWDDESQGLHTKMVHCKHNLVPMEHTEPYETKLGDDLAGRAAKLKIPQLIFENGLYDYSSDNFDEKLCKVAIPLFQQKQLIGVLTLNFEEPRQISKNHIETLMTIGGMTATKIEQTIHAEKIKLYQAQLEEYVHMISHDLKTPLRSIQALMTWIKEDNPNHFDEITMSNFDLIDITLVQMEKLISATMQYLKIGYITIYKETIDLNDLIDELELALHIPNHIKIVKERKLPHIEADKTQMIQIYQNLIDNAIKSIDKAKGLISLGWKKERDHYLFSVSDNGVGIPKQYKDKIFKLFQSLNSKSESSGVGLSIVTKLVRIHGGKIWVDSESGNGSTFYFTIKV